MKSMPNFWKNIWWSVRSKNLIYSVSRTHIKVFNYIFNVKISQIKIVKPIEVDHILTKTLAISSMKRKAIEFGMALQYPLSPIPLRLCNGNKTMRQTIKSGLCDILASDNPKRNSRSYYQKYWNDSWFNDCNTHTSRDNRYA